MARPRENFYLGLDLGNGNIKIVSEDFRETIPSYQDAHIPANVRGCVTDEGTTYLVGLGARRSLTKNRTVDNRTNKIDGIEKLYLGAIAHLPKVPSRMLNRIVVSSHAWKSHKDVIKSNLEKSKTVVLAGQEVALTTECLLVVPEGYGAVWERSDKVATLDFGTGTVILTLYDKGKPIESDTSKEGVQQLIRLISQEMLPINSGYPGDEDEIRRSLERGEMVVDGVNISKIYKDCLSRWWNENIKDLGNEAQKLAKEGFEIVCIGGGVALPGFSKVLSGKSFNPVSESPAMVNAIGLYDLAIHTAKKKGLYITAEVA